MKRVISFIAMIVLVLPLMACGKRDVNSASQDLQENIKQEILDGYPEEEEALLYDGKSSLMILTYDGVSVSVRVGHGAYNIPKVIDIVCPVVLETVEKNNCTLKQVTVQYYETDEKGDWIKDTVVNWDSDNGETGIFFVAATGEHMVNCTADDISEYYANLELDPVEQNDEEVQSIQSSYWINTETRKFHRINCGYIKDATNKRMSSQSRESLIEQGYSPCEHCNP